MKLCMIGAGHVGLVSAACFAELGNEVVCVDVDGEKIAKLKKGGIPFFEPGLEELVRKNVEEGRLSFTVRIEEGVKESELIFIAVGTPPRENGEADLSYVEDVSRKIAQAMEEYKIVVEKSTVPVKTGEWVGRTIKLYNIRGVDFDVVSNPEFLREGSAIHDFMHPDRIVIGVESEKSEKAMRELYKPLKTSLIVTDIKSAEIIKHASNSFLALKISYINAIANICERVGADVERVAQGMGLDKRIGPDFLKAGIGYGGSCFPKDVAAFIG
ncbi:UDP-glucose/GDP-mannose dehydrogenase family protein, partial [candidate division NPL-UPA2 bacterium]|nr:UDP-glucose/GDP-mannose dehydrogenase family protein [candidate division NPL-UPA2 bacterium]